jgi:propionyl-CoA synthetase
VCVQRTSKLRRPLQPRVRCAPSPLCDQLKGEVPLGFVVLFPRAAEAVAASAAGLEQLTKELVGVVRERIGAVAAFKRIVVVKRLPKTRSGKILRATLRQ